MTSNNGMNGMAQLTGHNPGGVMSDKAQRAVSFRPRGKLAERVELMQKLGVNQSLLFNDLLSDNKALKIIDAAIEKKRQEMRELLGVAA
jgi:hypothetical protein